LRPGRVGRSPLSHEGPRPMTTPDVATEASTEPRSRWRFWIIMTAVIGLPLALIVGLLMFWAASADEKLKAVLEETDRLDPNWRVPQMMEQRVVLEDDKNAALQVLKVKPLIPNSYASAQAFTDLFQNVPSEVQLNAQQIAALEAEQKRVADALTEA